MKHNGIRFISLIPRADPDLENVFADMDAWLAKERLEPCTCGHLQGEHDIDDVCTATDCPCQEFCYRESDLE